MTCWFRLTQLAVANSTSSMVRHGQLARAAGHRPRQGEGAHAAPEHPDDPRYAHLRPEHLNDGVEAMDAAFSGGHNMDTGPGEPPSEPANLLKRKERL
jgi:hypothetical protein